MTSGGYERFFTQDGKRYQHILSRTTGYPIDSDIESISIIAKRSIDAEIWTTCGYLAHCEASIQLLNRHNIAGILRSESGQVYKSEALCNLEKSGVISVELMD